MRTLLAALLFLLTLASVAFANVIDDAVAKALEAFKKGDQKTLEEVVRMPSPVDPWLVAAKLCRDGEHDAAAALARAAKFRDIEKLSAYIESRRGKQPNKAMDDANRAATAAFDEKDFKEAARILGGVKMVEDQVRAASLLSFKAYLLHETGRVADGTKSALEAARIAGELGWYWREAFAYEQVGTNFFNLSDFEGAATYWEKALGLHEKRRADDHIANLVGNVALAKENLGDFEAALKMQRRALALKEKIGAPLPVALTRLNIGNLELKKRDFEGAKASYALCLQAAREHGDRGLEASALESLALYHSTLRHLGKAIDLNHKALAIFETLNRPVDLGRCLSSLGSRHVDLGNPEKALIYLKRAKKAHLSIGAHLRNARVLTNMANAYKRLGRMDEAKRVMKESLELASAARDRFGVALTHLNLGSLLVHSHTYDEGLKHLREAKKHFQALGDRAAEAKALCFIGRGIGQNGDLPGAIKSFEQALALDPEYDDADKARRDCIQALAVLSTG